MILACHPRGGSTWLSEIMLHLQNSVLIDEPLWRGHYQSVNYMPTAKEGKLKSLSKLGFYFDQPIPCEAKWDEAREILEKTMKGEYWHYDLYNKNNILSRKKADIYITKFCYAHLMLPWIHQQFNLKSIVMHRHPCAVIASQLQHAAFQKIVKNPAGALPHFRYNDLYERYQPIWKKLDNPESFLAAIWAIKTKYITEQPPPQMDCLTLYYEDLIVDFANQIEKINLHFQIKLPESIYQQKEKPNTSTQTQALNGEQQLVKWKSILSNRQINSIMWVVDAFDVPIYGPELMPNYPRS